MILATANMEALPSVRMVSYRGISQGTIRFFTHDASRKARDIAHNPRAALLFDWNELRRQVRVEGSVTLMQRAEVEAYFASRPRGNQIASWVSARQTEALAPDESLMRSWEALSVRYA